MPVHILKKMQKCRPLSKNTGLKIAYSKESPIGIGWKYLKLNKNIVMKKIGFILLLNIVSILGYSQNEIFDYYVGSWKWENIQTGDSFELVLKKGSAVISESFGGGTEDCIIGAYKYVKNGMTFIDKISELGKNYDDAIWYPIWAEMPENIKEIMYFIVQDYEKINSFGDPKVLGAGECKLAFVSSNPKQMRWDLTRVDKENWDVLWVADERQIFPEGTSLPTNIILTKVE